MSNSESATDPGVLLEIRDEVAYVTVDRPDALNALDSNAKRRLAKVWCQIEDDKSLRAVVLTGAGNRAFCVGDDMRETSEISGLEYWANADPNGYAGLALRDSLKIPVIARVNGYALGGGFILLCGCDIIVASDGATFGLPESRVGRLPIEGGMNNFVRRVPYSVAMGMLLAGRTMSASEMERHGFVNEVVSSELLDETVQRWVDDIRACAPLSVRAIKDTVLSGRDLPPYQADNTRLTSLIEALSSQDSIEGVRAFREKRPPRWSGL